MIHYASSISSTEATIACYDIAIVGAGISSAYTLIHYISQLEEQALMETDLPQSRCPIKIVVTEKSGEFWTGIPYGSRSGRNALLISPLHEFIPQQLERENFIKWLTENRDLVFSPQQYNQGELSRKWLAANEVAMSKGCWDDLFIPRHVFGKYLQERVENLLIRATAKGLIRFDRITTDVLDIQQLQDAYRVDTANDTCFFATKVVLAIGSPPNVAFEQTQAQDLGDGGCYIDNMYEPSLDFNIDRICQSLQQVEDPAQRQVLIVGSNAGTLDTLYSINNSKAATTLIEKFVILSPKATFPHRIDRNVTYTPQHLIDLAQSKSSFTAKQILTAVEQDLACATAQSLNISDIHGCMSNAVMVALKELSPAEQKQFVIKYAVEIGKLQRRAGQEYLDVVDNLVTQTKLEFLKGKFVKYDPLTTGGVSCEYVDSDDAIQKTVDSPIRVIINCAGFQDVTKSSSVLIQNLIRRQICMPNDSNRGFITDKNFKVNQNCYLMGPLVAGNIDGNFKVWHAESCQRIIGLSKTLADELFQPAVDPVVAVPELVLVSAA